MVPNCVFVRTYRCNLVIDRAISRVCVCSADRVEVVGAIKRMGAFMRAKYPRVLAVGAAALCRRTWHLTDTIFSILKGEDGKQFLLRPIELRPPFLFYIGHMMAL